MRPLALAVLSLATLLSAFSPLSPFENPLWAESEERAESQTPESGPAPEASSPTEADPLPEAGAFPDASGSSVTQPARLSLPAPSLRVSVDSTYYDISGDNANAVRAQLVRLGPDRGAGRYSALTRWELNWSYQPLIPVPGGCQTGPIVVNLRVTMTYPRWSASGNVEAGLRERWRTYQTALEMHEQGHRDIAIQAANELTARLSELPLQQSCEQLDQVARGVIREVTSQQEAAQREYDRVTNHGVAQGAVFP
jgi:predicted secreted Zn-dependent protease